MLNVLLILNEWINQDNYIGSTRSWTLSSKFKIKNIVDIGLSFYTFRFTHFLKFYFDILITNFSAFRRTSYFDNRRSLYANCAYVQLTHQKTSKPDISFIHLHFPETRSHLFSDAHFSLTCLLSRAFFSALSTNLKTLFSSPFTSFFELYFDAFTTYIKRARAISQYHDRLIIRRCARTIL